MTDELYVLTGHRGPPSDSFGHTVLILDRFWLATAVSDIGANVRCVVFVLAAPGNALLSTMC